MTHPDQYSQKAAGEMTTARPAPISWAQNMDRGEDRVCIRTKVLITIETVTRQLLSVTS